MDGVSVAPSQSLVKSPGGLPRAPSVHMGREVVLDARAGEQPGCRGASQAWAPSWKEGSLHVWCFRRKTLTLNLSGRLLVTGS